MPAIIEKLEKLKPAYDKLYQVLLFICKILLIADISITCYSVAGRYVHQYLSFWTDPAWSEEIVLTLMSYMAVLSAALAIRRCAHIRMTAFDRSLPPVVIKVLDVAADIAVMILAIIMLAVGMKYAVTIGAKGTYISLPNLSKFWMYFPIPVAGLFMIIFELERIVLDVKKFYEKDEPKKEEVKA